jgi:hypothetical protein
MAQPIIRNTKIQAAYRALIFNKSLIMKDIIEIYNDIKRATRECFQTKTGPFSSLFSAKIIADFSYCELDVLAFMLFNHICNCCPDSIGQLVGNNFSNGLLVYYPFNETSGATVEDLSGDNLDLTITGLTATRSKPTIRTGGDVSTHFTNLAVASTTTVIPELYETTLSISVWYRPDTSADSGFRFFSGGTPLLDGDQAWNNHFCVFLDGNGTPGVFWESGVGTNVIYMGATPPVVAGQPYHFVGVKDGVNKKVYLYVNGVKVLDQAYTLEYNGGANVRLAIGNSQPGGENSVFSTRGDVQDFAMWTRTFNSCEVVQMYNGGAGLGIEQFG